MIFEKADAAPQLGFFEEGWGTESRIAEGPMATTAVRLHYWPTSGDGIT